MKYLCALWALLTEGFFVDVRGNEAPLPSPPKMPWGMLPYREAAERDPGECPVCHARADEPCDAGIHS